MATGRSIDSGTFVQDFSRSDKIPEKSSFKSKDKQTSDTPANFETTKPIIFKIPSYASGILNIKTTATSPEIVSTPSEVLLPPIGLNEVVTNQPGSVSNGILTTTLNSIEAETKTLLSVTQRPNFNTQFGPTTIQTQPNLFARNQNTPFSQNNQQTAFQFGFTPTAQVPISTTTKKTSHFVTESTNSIENSTLAPAFGVGFAKSLLDEILGNQNPGYAVRSDGSIDSEALPPQFHNQFITPKFATIQPITTQKLFEPTTTVSPKTTTTVSTNFTHNLFLQQATPSEQSISITDLTSKAFTPSKTNPFLPTTTKSYPTTTDSQFETTTQAQFTESFQFPTGTPAKSGLQFKSIAENENGFTKEIGIGIRDRLPVTTTLPSHLDTRGQFTSNSFKPFNTLNATAQNIAITPSFENLLQRNAVTQKPLNSFNIDGVTQANLNAHNNGTPNATSSLVIPVPDANLIAPLQGDTKFPTAMQTTTSNTIFTTVPSAKFPSIIFTSTLPPIVPTTSKAPIFTTTTTFASTVEQNQPSSSVVKPDQDLLPPVDAVSVTIYKTSSISIPSNGLLPPTTLTTKLNAETAAYQPKPIEFQPQPLNLNPFLPPFSGLTFVPSTDVQTTTSPPAPKSTIPQLPSIEFDYNQSIVPFVIEANVQGVAQQQQPQPQPQSNQQNQFDKKYNGGFGAPPGILTPYDDRKQ